MKSTMIGLAQVFFIRVSYLKLSMGISIDPAFQIFGKIYVK